MDFERRNLSCRLDNFTPEQRNDKRLTILKKMELLGNKVIPIFDEATQMVANFLNTPICILGIMIDDEFSIKSAIGLSRLGLMNKIAAMRKISRSESFSTYVIDSKSNLLVENTCIDPFFSKTTLTQNYGVCAYVGTPLITGEGECIGSLEVMDLVAHQFSNKELNFLAITARWCMAEYERNQLLINHEKQVKKEEATQDLASQNAIQLEQLTFEKYQSKTNYLEEIVKNLIVSLIKQLSNPLTLIIGMASVLKGETYGHLSPKQKEYIEIVYDSGKDMNLLMDKILDLDNFHNKTNLELTSFDLKLLITKVINSLELLAQKQQHTFNLSIEPGNRIWKLDKQKITLTIYYILTTIIEGSISGGEVQIHISHRDHKINFSFWVIHPWLGEEISFENTELYTQIISRFNENKSNLQQLTLENYTYFKELIKSSKVDLYGLLFSCYLAELQKGKIFLKGSTGSGYRFVLSIPLLEEEG
jgi:hypothetical protein